MKEIAKTPNPNFGLIIACVIMSLACVVLYVRHFCNLHGSLSSMSAVVLMGVFGQAFIPPVAYYFVTAAFSLLWKKDKRRRVHLTAYLVMMIICSLGEAVK